MVDAMDPLDTHTVARILAGVIQEVERGADQAYIITKAAIHQHKIKSKYSHGENIHQFGSTTFKRPDVPFYVLAKFPRFAPLLKGRPVNFGCYGGEIFLHMKYMGIGLSSKADGDVLHHFHVPRKGIIPQGDAEELVREMYIMLRNMLEHGMSSNYLARVTLGYVLSTQSPFATQQVAKYMPFGIAPLVATSEVVAKVLHIGTFERLGEEHHWDAQYMHGWLSSLRISSSCCKRA